MQAHGRRLPPRPAGAEWVKVKARHDMTAMIGGFTEGAGSRRGTVGALLVGEPGEEGLTYLSHVGSGITGPMSRALWDRLSDMETDESPFANAVPKAPQPAPLGAPGAALRGALRRADAGQPAARLGLPRAGGGGGRGPRPARGPVLPGERRPGGAGGRAHGDPHQPRQGLLAGRGHPEGAPARPLPAHGARARAAPRRPADDPEALSERDRGGLLLPAHGQRRAVLDAHGRPLAQRPGRREDEPLRAGGRPHGRCCGSSTSATSTSTRGRAPPRRPTSRSGCSSTSTPPTACPTTGWWRRPCWCAMRSRPSGCAATRGPRGPAACTSWCRSRPGTPSTRSACSRAWSARAWWPCAPTS